MIRTAIGTVGIATMLGVSIAAFSAEAEKRYGPGVSDTEIKIGQTMPYSGPLSTAGNPPP